VSAGNVKKELDALSCSAIAETLLHYTDPPVYPRPVLELLGSAALKARDFPEAERLSPGARGRTPAVAERYVVWPKRSTGKKEDAAKMMAEFRRVWRGDELN